MTYNILIYQLCNKSESEKSWETRATSDTFRSIGAAPTCISTNCVFVYGVIQINYRNIGLITSRKVHVPMYQSYVVQGVIVWKCCFSLHDNDQFKTNFLQVSNTGISSIQNLMQLNVNFDRYEIQWDKLDVIEVCCKVENNNEISKIKYSIIDCNST